MRARPAFTTIFFLGMLITACTPKNSKTFIDHPQKERHAFVFPDDWLGYWEGNLTIYDFSGPKQTLPMAIDNQKTDTPGLYTWAIIYGADTIVGRRDYQLIEVNDSLGHYRVDEKNGILIDSYLIDNELRSVFDVMNNTLTSTYRRTADKMEFEILMYKSEPLTTTGDTLINGDRIPAVRTYKPVVTQKATLVRR